MGLFHNELMNERSCFDVFEQLTRLQELSIDGNPVSTRIEFKYELILRLQRLEMLDEETVQELDRDVAQQYFLDNRLVLPGQSALKKVELTGNDCEKKEGEDNLEKKKKVKFMNVDDDDNNWQNQQIKALSTRITELIVENEQLKSKVEKKHYEQVYRDNELMKMELKNMYGIMEENKDIKEDLLRLKSLTYEDRMKQMNQENQLLRKRNGELLIHVSELERKIQDLKKQQTLECMPARPQTSQGAFMRHEDLDSMATDDFGKELNEMILKNQQRLAELQSDFKYPRHFLLY